MGIVRYISRDTGPGKKYPGSDCFSRVNALSVWHAEAVCDTRKSMYKRIILKLSGEALAGPERFGLDAVKVAEITEEIADVHKLGVEIGIVVGGGNFFRGVAQQAKEMDRV